MPRNTKGQKFNLCTAFAWEEVSSRAFQTLSLYARAVLFEARTRMIVRKRAGDLVYEIKTSYRKDGGMASPSKTVNFASKTMELRYNMVKRREVEDGQSSYLMSDRIFYRAVKELRQKGWFDLIRPAHFPQDGAVYSPSLRWRRYGQVNFESEPPVEL